MYKHERVRRQAVIAYYQNTILLSPKSGVFVNNNYNRYSHMMQCTADPCWIFTLFLLMRILSIELYTCIQPSSVPNHMVGSPSKSTGSIGYIPTGTRSWFTSLSSSSSLDELYAHTNINWAWFMSWNFKKGRPKLWHLAIVILEYLFKMNLGRNKLVTRYFGLADPWNRYRKL